MSKVLRRLAVSHESMISPLSSLRASHKWYIFPRRHRDKDARRLPFSAEVGGLSTEGARERGSGKRDQGTVAQSIYAPVGPTGRPCRKRSRRAICTTTCLAADGSESIHTGRMTSVAVVRGGYGAFCGRDASRMALDCHRRRRALPMHLGPHLLDNSETHRKDICLDVLVALDFLILSSLWPHTLLVDSTPRSPPPSAAPAGEG